MKRAGPRLQDEEVAKVAPTYWTSVGKRGQEVRVGGGTLRADG